MYNGVVFLRLFLLSHCISRVSASPHSTRLSPGSSPRAAFSMRCCSWGVASGYGPLSLAVDLDSSKASGHSPLTHLPNLAVRSSCRDFMSPCYPLESGLPILGRPDLSLMIPRVGLKRKKTLVAHWSPFSPLSPAVSS